MAKAVARVLFVLEDKALPQLPSLLPLVLQRLQAAAAAPSCPTYSHFLFEALALLARLAVSPAAASDLALQNHVEQAVVPVLSVFVKEGNHEFTPYCFQVGFASLQQSAHSFDAERKGVLLRGCVSF